MAFDTHEMVKIIVLLYLFSALAPGIATNLNATIAAFSSFSGTSQIFQALPVFLGIALLLVILNKSQASKA